MIPDVPVSKFALTIFGGKRGVLLTSEDLCRGKQQTLKVALKAQNGKHVGHRRLPLKTPGLRRVRQEEENSLGARLGARAAGASAARGSR